MNKIYKSIFNAVRGKWVVVSEATSSYKQPSKTIHNNSSKRCKHVLAVVAIATFFSMPFGSALASTVIMSGKTQTITNANTELEYRVSGTLIVSKDSNIKLNSVKLEEGSSLGIFFKKPGVLENHGTLELETLVASREATLKNFGTLSINEFLYRNPNTQHFINEGKLFWQANYGLPGHFTQTSNTAELHVNAESVLYGSDYTFAESSDQTNKPKLDIEMISPTGEKITVSSNAFTGTVYDFVQNTPEPPPSPNALPPPLLGQVIDGKFVVNNANLSESGKQGFTDYLQNELGLGKNVDIVFNIPLEYSVKGLNQLIDEGYAGYIIPDANIDNGINALESVWVGTDNQGHFPLTIKDSIGISQISTQGLGIGKGKTFTLVNGINHIPNLTLKDGTLNIQGGVFETQWLIGSGNIEVSASSQVVLTERDVGGSDANLEKLHLTNGGKTELYLQYKDESGYSLAKLQVDNKGNLKIKGNIRLKAGTTSNVLQSPIFKNKGTAILDNVITEEGASILNSKGGNIQALALQLNAGSELTNLGEMTLDSLTGWGTIRNKGTLNVSGQLFVPGQSTQYLAGTVNAGDLVIGQTDKPQESSLLALNPMGILMVQGQTFAKKVSFNNGNINVTDGATFALGMSENDYKDFAKEHKDLVKDKTVLVVDKSFDFGENDSLWVGQDKSDKNLALGEKSLVVLTAENLKGQAMFDAKDGATL